MAKMAKAASGFGSGEHTAIGKVAVLIPRDDITWQ